MAKLTIEEKTRRQAIRKAQRLQAKQAAWAAANPELAAFWANSASASVLDSYARGDFTVVVAK